MITTLFQAEHDHIQSPNTAATGERGEGPPHRVSVTHTASTTGGSGGDDEATASPPAIYTASTTSHPRRNV